MTNLILPTDFIEIFSTAEDCRKKASSPEDIFYLEDFLAMRASVKNDFHEILPHLMTLTPREDFIFLKTQFAVFHVEHMKPKKLEKKVTYFSKTKLGALFWEWFSQKIRLILIVVAPNNDPRFNPVTIYKSLLVLQDLLDDDTPRVVV
ncbi:hypothetical protein ASSaV_gp04 [Abalone shriveling syndrome-associated virus]|uniref:hypothetical protein n=1 Tax=Abalone shriveling syndrome-associated virus TaxID=491893 RepID=UPI0001881BBF|nr:hypothetical protein ASSaV_gp04 [Abalone shriveling syndrome-associated virus]ACJ72000.1 unknown [Abalone shriveling syndrome-associated virus]